MLKVRIAEWMLSLVLDPERSAAAVGDLIEEGSGGALQFSISASRIFISGLLRSFVTDWPRIVRLAGWGVLLNFGGMLVMIAVIIGLAALFGFLEGFLWSPSRSAIAYIPLIGTILGVAVVCPIEFHVGKLIARRSPGQEIAVGLLAILIGEFLGGVIEMILSGRVDLRVFSHGSSPAPLAYLVLLAGVVLERRRRIAAAKPVS
jgi:hypothetical protein